MPWDRVHAEAEVLEHVLSEELEELIAARLGDPTVDPHGDPIPTPELGIDERQTRSLDELAAGDAGRFVRVSDSDPEMLRYLAEHGIAIGDRLEVVERQPFGGPVFVRFGEREHPIGGALARAMRIETEEGQRMTPLRPDPTPALQGAVEGASVALPGDSAGARGPERARAAPRQGSPARDADDARPGVRRLDRLRRSRATSPPTSKVARSSATCCCGSCSRRT